jgi:hypothetical protein
MSLDSMGHSGTGHGEINSTIAPKESANIVDTLNRFGDSFVMHALTGGLNTITKANNYGSLSSLALMDGGVFKGIETITPPTPFQGFFGGSKKGANMSA